MTPRKNLLLLRILLLALPGMILAASALPAISEPLRLRTGFPAYAFAGMDANDSETASSFYLKKMSEDLGMVYSSRIYQDRAELFRDMVAGKLDFVLLCSADLLRTGGPETFTPILAPMRGQEIGESFQLLVHRESGIKTLADLRGRTLLSFVGSDSVLEDAWLNRELAAASLPPAKNLFRAIDYPQAVSKTVLPVFFRKADACIISQSLVDVIAQLNPQVRDRLVPLIQSEVLLTCAMCLRSDYPAEGRRKLVESAVTMGNTVQGRQLMTLTKITQVLPYDPAMLKSVTNLAPLTPVASPAHPAAPPAPPPVRDNPSPLPPTPSPPASRNSDPVLFRVSPPRPSQPSQ